MAMHSDDDYMVTEEASVGYQKRTLIDHVNEAAGDRSLGRKRR